MSTTADNHNTSVEENSSEKNFSPNNDHSSLENSEIIEEFQTENARRQLDEDNVSIATSRFKRDQNVFRDNNDLVQTASRQASTKTLTKTLTGED